MQPFAEIIVGIERFRDDTTPKPDYNEYSQIFGRFIDLYRSMTGDIRIRAIESLDRHLPIIFWNFVLYKGQETAGISTGRINANWPELFEPWYVPLEEYARRVPADNQDGPMKSLKFADYLVSGAFPPEPQKALMDCLETLDRTRRFKFAVVECFSIAEIIWNQLFIKIAQHSPDFSAFIDSKKRENGSVPAKVAINAILPQIFDTDENSNKELIRALNRIRSKRDGIVHKGEDCNGDFPIFAVQAAQNLINKTQLALHPYGEEVT